MMTTSTTTTSNPEPKTASASELTAKHTDEAAKLRDKDGKTMANADVRDRLLLEMADRIIAHPEGLSDRISALRGELAEDMGMTTPANADQIIQHPDVRAAERKANEELAVGSAKSAGLVGDDHKPAPDANPQLAHPTSSTVPTVSVPAGAPASEVKQDKPSDPSKK